MNRDYFDVMGVKRAYHLDPIELAERYLSLSKQTHPDRFAKALPSERLEAVMRNTELNDAYKVLKHDIKRAEYLLKLEGIDVGEEKPQATTGATKQLVVDAKLLIEIMELREGLAEARADKDEKKVAEMTADVKARKAKSLALVDSGLGAYERGDRSQLDAVARALVSIRYYGRFLDEAETRDENNG